MIAVCGPSEATAAELALAREVGELIARRGHALVCGGRGGVMEAACRGAREAGGATIGILPGYDPADANRWVEHVICTGMGHARNAAVVASGQAVIAVSGGFGTLSEVALALAIGRPVVTLESWELEPRRVERFGDADFLMPARTPREAVELALAAIERLSQDRD